MKDKDTRPPSVSFEEIKKNFEKAMADDEDDLAKAPKRFKKGEGIVEIHDDKTLED